jgi:hypothetical protein
MKNKNKINQYTPSGKTSKLKEGNATYQKQVMIKDFTFQRFRKLYEKSPFSLKDWAGFLHLSERTLLRYGKENKSFEGIYADRVLQLENLFAKGKQVFKSQEGFFDWLVKPKNVLGIHLNVTALSTTQGITELDRELGRIQYGVYV